MSEQSQANKHCLCLWMDAAPLALQQCTLLKSLTDCCSLGTLLSIDGVKDGQLVSAGGGGIRVGGADVASAFVTRNAAIAIAITAEC